MFLFVGALLMAFGLLSVFHLFLFRKIPYLLSYAIVIITGVLMISAFNVHGIWLGLIIIIIGMLWIKFLVKKKSDERYV